MDNEQLIAYLNANNVEYNKAFPRAKNEGCISEYKPLFDKAYKKLEEYVLFGVNNGFSNDLREAINDITDTVIEIGKQSSMKKHDKIEKKFDEVYGKMDKDIAKKADNRPNIVDKVLIFIDNYQNSLTTMLNAPETPRKEILELSNVKLTELRKILTEVGDVSSTTALEFATKIVEDLKKWGAVIASNMYVSTTPTMLDQSISEATAWKNTLTGIKTNLFGKPKNLAKDLSALNFTEDNFSSIGEGEIAKEMVTVFRANLETFRNSLTKERFSTEEESEEIKAKQEELKKLRAEQDQCDQDFDNGVIDASTYNSMMDDIEFNIGELNAEIADLKKYKTRVNKQSQGFKKVLRKVITLARIIKSFEHTPRMLTYILSKIDFTKVNNVLTGIATDEDINHLLNISFVVQNVDEITQKTIQEIVDRAEEQDLEFEKINDELYSSSRVSTETQRVSEDEERAKAMERRNRRRNPALSAEPTPNPTPNANINPTPQANPTPNNFDDIAGDN